jgi:hypothetical protein
VAQGTETNCQDGADNDCDGKVDCQDGNCGGATCGANGRVCSGTSCVCSGNGGTAQSPESTCTDGRDNDCDGATDCNDSSCLHKRCRTTTDEVAVCCGIGPNTSMCKDVAHDEDHCGACGMACETGESCIGYLVDSVLLSGRCECNENSDCPGGQECESTQLGDRCLCSSSTECPSPSTCDTSPAGHCRYF